MIIPIIPIGGILLHLHQNNLTYHSTGKNIIGKIFNQKIIQKEKYEMKGEIKKNIYYRLTALRQSLCKTKTINKQKEN